MGWLTKKSVEKAEQNATSSGRCRCGNGFEYIGTGRSIWWLGFMGGDGEVRNVAEVFCRNCDGDKDAPAYGTPIYETEIVWIERR